MRSGYRRDRGQSPPPLDGQAVRTHAHRGGDVHREFPGFFLEGVSGDRARKLLEQMCTRLLANPVIEDYHVELVEESS